MVKRLWAGSLPLALITTFFVSSGVMISKVGWLTTVIGILVLVTAIGLIAAPKIKSIACHKRIAHPKEFKSI